MGQQESIKRIDTFIKRLDERELILIPEKCSKEFGLETKGAGFLGKPKREVIGTLGDMLSKTLAIYQQAKDSPDNSLRTLVIDDALKWINYAYTLGAVKPSDGIYKKYEDCLDQIKKLTREKKEIQDDYQQTSADLLESEAERRTLKRELDDLKERIKI